MSVGLSTARDTSSMASIVEFGNAEPLAADLNRIDAVLAEVYGPVAGADLTVPRDHAGLRERLAAAAPRSVALAERVHRTFADGACGIVVRELGLAQLEIDAQRRAMFAFAVLMGDVTFAHPVDNKVVWDVMDKGAPQTGAPKYSSFSENDREAEYHTDASFAINPDRYFLLYSAQQADCGGGQTFLADGRVLLRELEATAEGRDAVRVLSEVKLPMRVPKAFRRDGNAEDDGYMYRPLIGGEPLWRFRKDKVEKGLVAKSDKVGAEVRDAFDVVYRHLVARPDEYHAVIPTDGVLIVDNHVALHGRNGFTDSRRHLLRIRFHRAGTDQTVEADGG
ncbi:MAG: TauD/TfdA family dioxygenase [Pseudonocardia sp.]|jgi:alpha-ketoglutarate-dependent taurine dioxygenase